MARDYSLTDRFTGGGGLGVGVGSGGGSFIPGMPNQYDPAYGGIPRVPSPAATQSSSIAGNLGNLSNLYNLATGAGSASGAGVINALNQEIPGVSGSIGAATGNINQLLSGQVPGDVISQLQQQMAEIGAGQGMGPMAPNTNAGYLRALGLTSLGMKQQGMQGLNALMSSVPRAPAFDPSSMMVNPQQQQEWEYLAQMMANAPRPAAAAKANVDALKMGAGFGGSSPVGGFNLPVHGGPAFGGSPMLSSPDYGPDLVYGGTGSPDQYPSANPTPQAYQNWNNLASSWATPGSSQEDIYNLGLTPAIEGTGYGGDPYADPYSMDAIYGD